MSWIGVGRTVLDRYVLLKPIGYGGVSVVFEAIDTVLVRPAAIKLLSPMFTRDGRAFHAARREPEIMRQVRHPTVPKVYHFGDARLDVAARVPCLAMELLTGASLDRRLRNGPLPWQEAVEVAASVAELLAVAHRRGIAHRDLTPENVMLTTAGVKIIDFGLAAAFGTDFDAGPSQDVYALGVLLYRMLTGHSPYPADGLRHRPTLRPAPTPVLLVPGAPRSLADLCRACMAKVSTERPVSGAVAIELWATLLAMSITHCN